MPRPSVKAILREKELWLLVLLWAAFCYRPLFSGETFFFRDLCYISFPKRKHLLELFASWQLPLWDPYLHGGHPFLAALVNAVCYPTTLVYLFLPLVKAFNVAIVLDFLGCSLSAYVCGRALGLKRVSSLIVGIIYGFCGMTLSLGDQLRFFGMTQLPLLAACWHIYIHERRRRWFVAAALVGVMQVLRGAPEINVVSLLFLLGWSLVYPFEKENIDAPPYLGGGRGGVGRVFAWILLGAAILGLAAFQIAPTLEAITQSSRGGAGVQYGIFTQWSLHPRALPDIVFPEFRGYTDMLPYNVYFWGGDIGDKGYPYFLSLYLGGVTLALALVGAMTTDSRLPRRFRWFLCGVIAAAFLLAFGRFLPGFEWLYTYFPPIRIFRYPIKFLLAAIFPIALLAGYGAEILFSSEHQPQISRRLLAVGWGVALLLGMLALLFWRVPPFAIAVQQFFFGHTGDIIHAGVTRSLAHAAGIWFVCALLYHARVIQPRTWQIWALAAVLIVDFFSAGKRVNPLAPEAFFTKEPPIVDIARRNIGDGKLYRTEDPLPQMFYITPTADFPVAPDHIMWLYRWQCEVLRMYLAALYDIPVTLHHDYDLFAHVRMMKLKQIIASLPWERRLPLLAASGVSLVLTAENLAVPGLPKIADIPNLSDTPAHLYKLAQAAPPARVVTRWKMANSDEDALALMLQPDYDPRQHVALQISPPDAFAFPWTRNVQRGAAMLKSPAQCAQSAQATARVTERKNNSTRYAVSSACDGYLVFSEPFYPGWHVKIDGIPQPILRANYAFSAVALAAGTHDIVRYYLPDSFLLGMMISALTASCFCGLLLMKRHNESSVGFSG